MRERAAARESRGDDVQEAAKRQGRREGRSGEDGVHISVIGRSPRFLSYGVGNAAWEKSEDCVDLTVPTASFTVTVTVACCSGAVPL
jgi:hypothetical protein